MRIRVVTTVALSLLPALASGQRFPQPGVRRPSPGDPTSLPRQPEPIARAVEYQRLHISVETYPLVSHVQTSGFASHAGTAWTTFGAGTRGEYRFTRFVSGTLDITSSFGGGPVVVSSGELGTRIHPRGSEQRLDPFVDVRLGYVAVGGGELASDLTNPSPFSGGTNVYSTQYSAGWGGIVGGGADYGLTRNFSLTTELLATRSRLSTHDVVNSPTDPSYTLSSIRYTIGLKYTPVRTILH